MVKHILIVVEDNFHAEIKNKAKERGIKLKHLIISAIKKDITEEKKIEENPKTDINAEAK